jgi:hypothetical protein
MIMEEPYWSHPINASVAGLVLHPARMMPDILIQRDMSINAHSAFTVLKRVCHLHAWLSVRQNVSISGILMIREVKFRRFLKSGNIKG